MLVKSSTVASLVSSPPKRKGWKYPATFLPQKNHQTGRAFREFFATVEWNGVGGISQEDHQGNNLARISERTTKRNFKEDFWNDDSEGRADLNMMEENLNK